MRQLFKCAAITGFCTLIVKAIILLFRSNTVERILLNDKNKRLIDFARVMFLAFGISLILSGYLEKDSSKANIYVYGFTYVMSLFLSAALYFVVVWIMRNIGFRKNYFIKDEQHGKMYLIKNSKEKYVLIAEKYLLLADKAKVKDSQLLLFQDGSVIVNKKIYSEPKNFRRIDHIIKEIILFFVASKRSACTQYSRGNFKDTI